MLVVRKTLKSRSVKDNGQEKIPAGAIVKLTKIKGQPEIMYLEKQNRTIKIKKIDKDRYMTPDGEIRFFNHTRSRNENLNHVAETMKKIRNLINHNFHGGPNEKFIVLTYAENMMSSLKMYYDFKDFRKIAVEELGDFEYVNVIEPQGRGAWHQNLLLKFVKEPGFLSNEYVASLWRDRGFAYVKGIGHVKGIGNYLSVYLTDLEYTRGNLKTVVEAGMYKSDLEIIKKKVEGKSKKFMKGARLYLYPTGIQIFRKSKGILYPEEVVGSYKKLKDENNLAEPRYRRKIELLEYPEDKRNEMVLLARNIYEQYPEYVH